MSTRCSGRLQPPSSDIPQVAPDKLRLCLSSDDGNGFRGIQCSSAWKLRDAGLVAHEQPMWQEQPKWAVRAGRLVVSARQLTEFPEICSRTFVALALNRYWHTWRPTEQPQRQRQEIVGQRTH